ncbi:saccharopine dehydrogenase NADP-binding domain-containing protein [Nocardioides panacisoli]|uniref:saccharopine dehydrogenase family protein n=1 Tax=Nocardioides panacisoli TaxID=627624 RepID=UPI001C632A33|nr:saccharopine dehydrogenase NADP-binding domain-containing protein [Nocardioides panacisoli]QYJ03519.1 saccharopine dehydrogenase NADP-binding domain-containing protein [Nocardioides panacisoli]
MRIIIIGGAGDMGRVACAATVEDSAITSLVIADRDGDRARELADQLGPKATGVCLDITDRDALLAAIGDADVVLNTVGPFYLYGRPVLEAALEAGRHYVDIADDWEPTIQMLELDDAARAKDVTAIIGIGASPGLSNLLAAVAHDQLDSVEKLYTGWRGGSGIPKAPENREDVEPAAAIDHWIHNLAEPIRVWREGGFHEADALEELVIDYPDIGAGTVWTCGHPEPITLPRYYPEIDESLNVMFSRPGLIDAARKVRDRVRTGELTVPEASRELIMSPGRRGPEAGPVPDFPGVFAYAEGTKGGRPARVAVSTNYMPEGEMGEATCVPMAIAVGMLARGEIKATGVLGPEGCIDPTIFFERLAPFAGERSALAPLDVRLEVA